MSVPLLDLKAQYRTIKDEVDSAIQEVLESQYFILGPTVKAFEESVASYSNTPHAIGVSSGTDALLISMMAEDICPGDEVITTPYSFFATAGCISRLGAKPVFVEIEPESFNLDPAKIEAAITPATKAIIPVHLYGQVAEMDPIMDLAEKHNLAVIEDGAQAIGAEYNGRRAGSIGHYGCFSFFPSKNLGGVGDGGMVVATDDDRAEKLRILRAHGGKPKYYHRMIGGNFRLDAIQAAVLQVKLKYLDSWTAKRQENADRYREMFNDAGIVLETPECLKNDCVPGPEGCSLNGLKGVVLPEEMPGRRHIYNQFVLRVDKRDELVAWLKERKIGVEIYYPVTFNNQDCFKYLNYKKGDFPVSECAAESTLAIPIYPELTGDQMIEVVNSIEEFFKSY